MKLFATAALSIALVVASSTIAAASPVTALSVSKVLKRAPSPNVNKSDLDDQLPAPPWALAVMGAITILVVGRIIFDPNSGGGHSNADQPDSN
ncbi:hypothetical protein [Sphingomonas sp.]|uniref:hypothetical protein n=1 Tax=Sphingomonas sp. TaxID=28214 RepID=UPI0035C7B132